MPRPIPSAESGHDAQVGERTTGARLRPFRTWHGFRSRLDTGSGPEVGGPGKALLMWSPGGAAPSRK
ncbi:hypothetical protein GCM10009740_14120 [Terrabacter terrae]|uniref:Uncharacterized protein n=1 Tax=Terrabacter terrae TaxID=318434 RepID=A0ABN2TYZ1_9MICO